MSLATPTTGGSFLLFYKDKKFVIGYSMAGVDYFKKSEDGFKISFVKSSYIDADEFKIVSDTVNISDIAERIGYEIGKATFGPDSAGKLLSELHFKNACENELKNEEL